MKDIHRGRGKAAEWRSIVRTIDEAFSGEPMNDIARADKIVGFTPPDHFDRSLIDDIRRCRYLDWLGKQPKDEVEPMVGDAASWAGLSSLKTEQLASTICALDEMRKPKGDGLPPGPWWVAKPHGFVVCDKKHNIVVDCSIPHGNLHSATAIAAYIARCGSQPVRDILAACDDAELAQWADIIAKHKLPKNAVASFEMIQRAPADGIQRPAHLCIVALPRNT